MEDSKLVSDINRLKTIINTIPLVDNHCHPLFTHLQTVEKKEGCNPDSEDAQVHLDLRSMITEANGPALGSAQHTLASFRAVKQLATLLECEPNWESIEKAREKKDFETWTKRCLKGTHCLLVDDLLFLGAKNLETGAHGKLVAGGVKRIVRVEAIAEKALLSLLYREGQFDSVTFEIWQSAFLEQLEEVGQREDVAGFKSAVCYRTGLAVNLCQKSGHGFDGVAEQFQIWVQGVKNTGDIKARTLKPRLSVKVINDLILNHACVLAAKLQKPIQFHTGFGDNELSLSLADPSLLQPLIHEYPQTKFVLLHASYPFTRQAGYLASVYENVYLDFGLIFPMVSVDGQINVFRQILELCPTNKLLWSSDSLRFPEQYYLANLQGRETVSLVLSKYLKKGHIGFDDAFRIVKSIFFDNSNDLYDLRLSFPHAQEATASEAPAQPGIFPVLGIKQETSVAIRDERHHAELLFPPGMQYLRIQWVDYTGSLRLRVLPLSAVRALLRKPQFDVRITKAALSLLQDDTAAERMNPCGMFRLQPLWSKSSVRKFWPLGPNKGQHRRYQTQAPYATVMCGLYTVNPSAPLSYCPRNTLERAIETLQTKLSANLRLGFETEITFLKRTPTGEIETSLHNSHAWSQSTSFTPDLTVLLEEIVADLEAANIPLLMYHPESCDGQFEFVAGHLPAMEAVDVLYHTRLIIQTAAERHGYRATLHPKPYAQQAGTAAHVHFSLNFDNEAEASETHKQKMEKQEKSFIAGVLNHLEAICAFSMPTVASYDRNADGCWSGGTWIAHGDENREVPLRRCLAGEDGTGKDHWELRCVDGTANVYLVIAALLFAGLDGVDKNAELGPGCKEGEIPALMSEAKRQELGITKKVPSSLDDALDCLKRDEVMGELLGKEVVETLVDVKEGEIKKMKSIQGRDSRDGRWRWEIERY